MKVDMLKKSTFTANAEVEYSNAYRDNDRDEFSKFVNS